MGSLSGVNVVLAPCRHGDAETGKGCLACDGSGWVKVVPGPDGGPCACQHATADGKIAKCAACLGSGWAGMVG